MTKIPALALSLVLLLGPLSACSWLDGLYSPDTSNADQPKTRDFSKFPYEQMAPDAPPPPRAEFQTPRPTPPDEYLWRKGYWSYVDGKGFIWNAGYWMQKPAFTAVWRDDFWVQRAYGWVFTPGAWE